MLVFLKNGFTLGNQECEYGVEWTQKYTPWWSFRTDDLGTTTSDTLTLPCVSFDVHHIHGFYENSFRRPRFFYDQSSLMDIFWFRLSAYLFVLPIASVILIEVEKRVLRWYALSLRSKADGRRQEYVPVDVEERSAEFPSYSNDGVIDTSKL